ncbi:MAG: ATP-binding protein [Chthoniobacterales bacterium]
MPQESLKFKVSPHVVQDLGVNLYTTLSRVLVEFVANAYDADASFADITMDTEAIERARERVKVEFQIDKKNKVTPLIPLAQRTIAAGVRIQIEDDGHGMSRKDLKEKFLVVGRRRREEESKVRSPNGRVLMGRKGLGKLAGFGVAHKVEVISRKNGESHATQITLDFEKLVAKRVSDEVRVPVKKLIGGGGFKEKGTRIVLSLLVHDSIRGTKQDVVDTLVDYFAFVNPADFDIRLNAAAIKRPTPTFFFAHPAVTPDDNAKLISHTIEIEGEQRTFDYRIRFTEPGKHLPSVKRGIRVYAHNRMASAPDTFELNTGVHGFQYLSYMDGVVVADFVDDQPVDYIATDRQSLRWETPLLAPMREFLTKEMIVALKTRADMGEKKIRAKVKEDPFTKKTISDAKLPAHRKSTAYQIAAALAQSKAENLNDPFYKKALPQVVRGLGQGELFSAISTLAAENIPDFQELIRTISKLTAREFDDFITFTQGRLDAIAALGKLYKNVNFKQGKNEKKLHLLFKKNPWLLNPMFTQFLTSDATENEMQDRLARFLQIDKHPPRGYSASAADETASLGKNKRPDLVFLLGSRSLQRIVIVELKAPNTPLHEGHLAQLKGYMQRAETWLKDHFPNRVIEVEGILIGSHADTTSHAEKVEALRYEISKNPRAAWKVYDIGEILDQTRAAHDELRTIYDRAAKRAEKRT